MEDELNTEIKNSGDLSRKEEAAGNGETSPMAEVLLQLAAVLAQTRSSERTEAELPPFDGSYSARQFFQSYDRKMDDAHVDAPDKLLRLLNYLTRQPLELFRKLRLATQSYFQVRQTLTDLYPESSEASFAKYFAMKLAGQADLETYYREKTAMGLQLGLPQEVILETLTEGLPLSDQRLVRVVHPESLGEWFRLAQRIHGPNVPTARHREAQPPTMSGPYPSTPRRTGAWTAPTPPSNYLVLGEVCGRFISVVGDHFFRSTVQELAEAEDHTQGWKPKRLLMAGGVWMASMSSGAWLPPRRRRLLELWEQASSILGLKHRVVPTPTLLNLSLVGACRFLATPSLRAPLR
ncbi:hypothetical protein LAZ67_3002081 [Cordylochernes scorpioides]|uniref:Uncharacterized protein n=1 Tax=Cordylochernes scorpioides TaxID=51811 RepID=A0ABY6K8C4_9ARAC|nr:hypothetical protein LAZ67_3002081 [Cordylochernes scorpioides]